MPFFQRKKRLAYSLIELLICVAIVSILVGIAAVVYQGSMDRSELKLVVPVIVKTLKNYRDEARNKGKIITVEFVLDAAKMRIVKTAEDGPPETKLTDFQGRGLFKRKLYFRDYEWPDGSDAPATFTFYPQGDPAGGTVTFGSGFADSEISIKGDRVASDLP